MRRAESVELGCGRKPVALDPTDPPAGVPVLAAWRAWRLEQSPFLAPAQLRWGT